MLELEAARDRILDLMPLAQLERLPLVQAHRRILGEPILSPIDLPTFDNSAMDGYAVRAADLSGASAASPVRLQLAGRVSAGEIFSTEVMGGTCVRIFTGSTLPKGADAVVMQEDTSVDSINPGVISFLDGTKPWENIRFRGEDVKSGMTLAELGVDLTASRISLLAATGLAEVSVGRQPTVGLLATGSELLAAGQAPSAGKIYENNRAGLAALMIDAGAIPKMFPLVPDTFAETRVALETAFEECDIVVTSGGVSVGEMDFVKSAFEEMGGHLEFWKVAIRPGRPFVFGRYRNKFLFGLPGNPVSAFITFLLLVRPALARWQGATKVDLPIHRGTLAETISNQGDRRHFMRVTIDDRGEVHSAGAQGSHILTSLAAANGLLDVAPKTTLPRGTNVCVMRWT